MAMLGIYVRFQGGKSFSKYDGFGVSMLKQQERNRDYDGLSVKIHDEKHWKNQRSSISYSFPNKCGESHHDILIVYPRENKSISHQTETWTYIIVSQSALNMFIYVYMLVPRRVIKHVPLRKAATNLQLQEIQL